MNFFKVTMILTLVLPGMMLASSGSRKKDIPAASDQLRALTQPKESVSPKRRKPLSVGSYNNNHRHSVYMRFPKKH